MQPSAPRAPRSLRGLRGAAGRRLLVRLRRAASLVLVLWVVCMALALLPTSFAPGPSHGDGGVAAASFLMLGAPTALTLILPRAGGVVLLLAGMAWAAWLGMAAPTVVLGAVHALLGGAEPPDDRAGGDDAAMVS